LPAWLLSDYAGGLPWADIMDYTINLAHDKVQPYESLSGIKL